MKFLRIFTVFIIILILQSCATTKLTEEGNTAYKAGNYESALNTYNQIIEKRESTGHKAKATVYMNAGKAAIELNQTDKARKYLESAKELQYASPELYESLAKVYKTIDNLSKEITALETYHKKYPQGENIDKINARLFETYVESENWDLAIKLWPEVETQAQTNNNLLAGYLIVNKNKGNYDICDKLANQLLKKDKNNIAALEYYAVKYFDRADNLYVSEMTAYKNHRTRSQYNKLLKALDKVWPDYKQSRNYFLKLYKLDPKPEYAGYLSKIYTRYDDKQKAAYYEKKSR